MSGSIFLSADTKEGKYIELKPQLEALILSEPNLIANLSNLSAALKEAFNWLWVGFYFKEEDQLLLGPFQGPIACTRIPIGKGVCGTCAEENKSIIVANVNEFSGHIACSSATKSEIVIPINNEKGEFELVLDIDSEHLNHFDEVDQKHLYLIAEMITNHHYH